MLNQGLEAHEEGNLCNQTIRINRWIAGTGADAGDGIQVFVCLPVVGEEEEGKKVRDSARSWWSVCCERRRRKLGR